MFTAAGFFYGSTDGLTAKQISAYSSPWLGGEMNPVYEDRYGRRVLHLKERYPCFDSYDFLHENRYYHWYFIEHKDGVTVVYADDGRRGVKISSDIPHKFFDELKLAGFVV